MDLRLDPSLTGAKWLTDVIRPQQLPRDLWASTISDGSKDVPVLGRYENRALGFILMYSIPVDALPFYYFPYGFHLVELDL